MLQTERNILRRYISAADIFGLWIEPVGAMDLGKPKGAYLLALNLSSVCEAPRALGGAPTLEAGWYLYAGSAWGGGGITARVGRHFRKDKKRHWHIDHLTHAAADISALAVPDGRECELVARLLGTSRFETAMPGFGSSDCARCESHLLRFVAG